MLKLSWSCCECHASGTVEDPTEICGACPNCFRHKGEVEYTCLMSLEEFLTELTNMSESDMAKNCNAIHECAFDLLQNL